MQESIMLFFNSIANPFLDVLAEIITMFGEQLIVIAVVLWIYWCHDKRKGFAICADLMVSLSVTGILKAIVKYPRPFQKMEGLTGKRVETATGYSFPSGHSATAASFYSSIAFAFRKRPLSICCALLILLVPLSRLYLLVHWPLDVLTGIIIGTSLTLVLYRRFLKLYDDAPKRNRFLIWTSSITYALSLVLTILLSLDMIDSVAYSDLNKTFAIMAGGTLGMYLQFRYNDFSTDGTIGKKILRFAVGIIGVLVIMGAIKALFAGSLYHIGCLLRYSAIGIWALGLYPVVCRKLFG